MAFPVWTPPVNPSQQSSGASLSAKLIQSNFGDAYVQRAADGINNVVATQPLTWASITAANWTAIETFLLSVMANGQPFYYTMPGDTTWRKWTCTAFKRGDYNGSFWQNASATLTQDFTPDPSPPTGYF